jgi:hypothetical protein
VQSNPIKLDNGMTVLCHVVIWTIEIALFFCIVKWLCDWNCDATKEVEQQRIVVPVPEGTTPMNGEEYCDWLQSSSYTYQKATISKLLDDEFIVGPFEGGSGAVDAQVSDLCNHDISCSFKWLSPGHRIKGGQDQDLRRTCVDDSTPFYLSNYTRPVFEPEACRQKGVILLPFFSLVAVVANLRCLPSYFFAHINEEATPLLSENLKEGNNKDLPPNYSSDC